jgi:2-polyprenyl-3-methyl-5-hydroxy-6-metoxy-1,4-benzoquinol methylase
MLIKEIVRALTPPILWRAAAATRRSVASRSGPWEYGAEQPAEFYDERYHAADNLRVHYTESTYYPVWVLLAERIRRVGASSVLDIGCGPGQLANLLRDQGLAAYIGLDFSSARIRRARVVCPDFEFVAEDVFETHLFDSHDYDCILTTEFLEHVERDLDVLKRVKPGTVVFATVPNFPSTGHVRYFRSIEEVRDRYAHIFRSLRIDEHLANSQGKTFYVLEGRT